MPKEKITLQDWVAIAGLALTVVALCGAGMKYIVTGTEARVIEAIRTVDYKVEKVDNKVEKHIDFHLTNKLQCKEDVTNAEEEDTEETSTSERVEVAWRGEGKRTEGKEIRKN